MLVSKLVPPDIVSPLSEHDRSAYFTLQHLLSEKSKIQVPAPVPASIPAVFGKDLNRNVPLRNFKIIAFI
jgi:hypothetical protein